MGRLNLQQGLKRRKGVIFFKGKSREERPCRKDGKVTEAKEKTEKKRLWKGQLLKKLGHPGKSVAKKLEEIKRKKDERRQEIFITALPAPYNADDQKHQKKKGKREYVLTCEG